MKTQTNNTRTEADALSNYRVINIAPGRFKKQTAASLGDPPRHSPIAPSALFPRAVVAQGPIKGHTHPNQSPPKSPRMALPLNLGPEKAAARPTLGVKAAGRSSGQLAHRTQI